MFETRDDCPDNATVGEQKTELFDVTKCVVVVIDKQRWYMDPQVSPFIREQPAEIKKQVIETVEAQDKFIDTARKNIVPVIWTTFTEGAPDSPRNTLGLWEKYPDEPRLLATDKEHKFFGGGPTKNEIVVPKHYPDSFSSQEFTQKLKKLEKSTLLIVGGYAGRCVMATAFSGQVNDYDVTVVEDLIIPHPLYPEEKNTTIGVVQTLVGTVTNSSEVTALWETQHST